LGRRERGAKGGGKLGHVQARLGEWSSGPWPDEGKK